MPEIAIDEYDGLLRREHQVGPTGKHGTVQPVSNPLAPKGLPQRNLGLVPLASDCGHHGRSDAWVAWFVGPSRFRTPLHLVHLCLGSMYHPSPCRSTRQPEASI